MNVTFEKTGDARGLVTVTVAEADYTEKVNDKLKQIGKTHTVPGFRKGHISLPELRKRFGREVKSEAINDVVINAVFDYIKENNIKLIGQPLPAESKEIDLKETDYTFTYDVALWPEINLVLNKDVKLPFYTIDVTKEIVITPHVIKTLRALPTEERVAVAAALTGEMLLGTDVGDLRPIENMIYSIIRFYVNQDSARYRDSKQ